MKMTKGIILIILFLLFSVSIRSKEVVSLGDDRFETREEKITSQLTGDRVAINSAMGLSGTLSIVTGDAGEASFAYRKILKTSDPSEAMDYADLIQITLESAPDGLKLVLQAPNPAPWSGGPNSGMVDGELYLPADCRIEIDAAYFDIKIEGPFKSIKNKSSFGRIDVRKITEEINLTTSSRGITAKDIAGDISLATGNGEIKIENLSSPTHTAEISDDYADIFITNATGSANIRNNYGKIRLENMHISGPDSRIAGSYGLIKLEISDIRDAAIAISNSNEDVQITLPDTISAKFILRVSSRGKITVEGLKINPTMVKNDQLEFVSGAGESEVTVNIEGNGNISLKGSPAKER